MSSLCQLCSGREGKSRSESGAVTFAWCQQRHLGDPCTQIPPRWLSAPRHVCSSRVPCLPHSCSCAPPKAEFLSLVLKNQNLHAPQVAMCFPTPKAHVFAVCGALVTRVPGREERQGSDICSSCCSHPALPRQLRDPRSPGSLGPGLWPPLWVPLWHWKDV